MPKIPGVNHLRAIRAFEKFGFRIVRQGKHVVMTDGTPNFYAKPRAEISNLEKQLKTARDKVAHLYARWHELELLQSVPRAYTPSANLASFRSALLNPAGNHKMRKKSERECDQRRQWPQ